MGRPRKQVDEKAVERAAAIGCTLPEIAVVCGVSQDTIERRFAEALKRGRERGKRSLRRMQWKAAKSGNVTMQIWLGKQLLAQKDKVEHSGPDDGPIQLRHATTTLLQNPSVRDAALSLAERLGDAGTNGHANHNGNGHANGNGANHN